MSERTLEAAEAVVETEVVETEVAATTTEESAEAPQTLEAMLSTMSEPARKEYETLKKKSQDFDGLVAKKKHEKPAVKVTEDSIRAVLYKDNEKKVLKEVVKPTSTFYIAELVDDKNFQQIVAYLPRSIDKSSPEAIHRALKLATKNWKEDQGEETKRPEAELAASRGSSGEGATQGAVTRTERKFIKKAPEFNSWYAKK